MKRPYSANDKRPKVRYSRGKRIRKNIKGKVHTVSLDFYDGKYLTWNELNCVKYTFLCPLPVIFP